MGVVGPGVPGWVDFGSPDFEASKAFYCGLFGWEAGAAEHRMGARRADSPHWAVYFSIADCVAAAAKATELGGTVVQAPTDMPPGGRFASVMDRGGAQFLISSFTD